MLYNTCLREEPTLIFYDLLSSPRNYTSDFFDEFSFFALFRIRSLLLGNLHRLFWKLTSQKLNSCIVSSLGYQWNISYMRTHLDKNPTFASSSAMAELGQPESKAWPPSKRKTKTSGCMAGQRQRPFKVFKNNFIYDSQPSESQASQK